jgi:beta-lactamase regulating signal transducer with metallopeptidase domain
LSESEVEMEALLQFGLANAAAAALLAIVVATVTRFWRNPYLAHVLWAIVLLRLIAPPMLQIPLRAPEWFARQPAAIQPPMLPEVVKLEPAGVSPGKHADSATAPRPAAFPDSDLIGASHDPPAPLTVPPGRVAPTTEAPTPTTPQPLFARSLRLFDVLAGVWIAGTVLYVAITAVRVQRFARALQRSQCPASGRLQDEISDIAKSIGQRRVPRVVVVDAPLPPMVWSGWRPVLLVPQRIVESIDPSQRRLLLLHELLHIRRGDHLVRWFAVGVLAVYWWNPFAWWAVRRLQNAEEECCDAAVLSFHPHDCETYGEALLAVSEFVSCGSLPAAAVSVGVERKNHLKRRMTMILKGSRWPRLSKAHLATLIGCGAVLIGVSLTTTAAQVESAREAKPTPKAESDNASAPQPAPAATQPAPATPEFGRDNPGRPAPQARQELPTFLRGEKLASFPSDPETRRVLVERYNAAIRSVELFHKQYEMNTVPLASVLSSARSALEAKLALAQTQRERARAVADYHNLALYCWREAHARLEAGVGGASVPADEAQAHEAIFDARLKMEQLFPQGKVKQPGPALKSPKTIPSPVPATTPQQESVAAYGWKSVLITPDDDERHKLLKERYNSAVGTLHLYRAQQELGGNIPSLGDLLAAAKRVRVADLAINDKPPGDLEALERYLAFTKSLEQIAESRLAIGSAVGNLPVERAEMREARLAAEIELSDRRSAIAAAAKAEQDRLAKLRRPPVTESQSSRPDRTMPDATERKNHPIVSSEKSLPAMLTAEPLEPAAGDHELVKLFKERHNAALKSLQGQYERAQIDAAMPMVTITLAAAGRTLLDAELALSSSKDNVPLYERYLELTKFFEGRAAGLLKAKIAGPADFDAAREARLDAEIKLMQAKYMTSPMPRRTGANVQALEVRVRIAEAEVNAARAAHDQSQSEMKRALANLKYRQLQLDRIQSLRRRKAASAEDVDGATHARDEAAATVETARAAIQAAEAQGAIKLAQLEQVKMELQQARSGEGK